ncbi:Imm3 family immunity protein [Bacillus sp. S10(2024)]
MGEIEILLHRPLEGIVKQLILKRQGKRWYAIFSVERQVAPSDIDTNRAIGEILITHEKVFVGTVERITRCLSMFNPLDAEEELTKEEIADLSNRIKKVLEGLRKVEIDYNPYAG